MQAGTDATLIDASRRGDRPSFAQIIERHHRAVYAVAYSGVRDHARAEDIAQDTFVLAWRRLDDLRDPERLAAWLCGIARNLAREERRRMARTGEMIAVIDASTPFEALSDAESERLIAAGLADVPDVYREPLVLFYYQDRSVEDVARALGITPATTNKRLSRGRRFLAERVATIIERGLRGPSPAFAGAVIAAIALLPAPHVDASTLKGSTMFKLAIATVITTAAAGIGIFAASTVTGTPAHAKSEPTAATPKASSPSCIADYLKAAAAKSATSTSSPHAMHASPSPTLAVANATEQATDCATVGRHLAELEADATHGPNNRPDEATCEQCAKHYSNACETDNWSAERRACTLQAADLLNAHLCAGAAPQASAPTANLAPELQCPALGQHIADTVHAGGLFADVTDMNQQVDSACQLGSWTIELRQCFAAATTVPALQACVDPNAH